MVTQEEYDKDLERWRVSQQYNLPPYLKLHPTPLGYQIIENPRAAEIYQNYLKSLDSKPQGAWTSYSPEKDGININLNFFLRLLGASKEVIDDDQKTLEFMMDIKKRLDEANGVTTTGGEPNEHEYED